MLDHDRFLPRVLLAGLFVLYLVLLTWIVVWKLEPPWVGAAALLPRPIKLVPFVATAEAGASAPIEVVVNLALFVPFGLYLGLLVPRWSLRRATAVFAGSSLVLEIAQHVLSVGSFDITDVLVNTAGGAIGLGVLALARHRAPARTARVATTLCLIGTAVALLGIGTFLASPLHFAQQRDVVVSPP